MRESFVTPIMRVSLDEQVDVGGNQKASLVKPLAPDDVRTGDFVTLLQVAVQIPSFFWCEDSILLPPSQPVRMQFIPDEAGIPLKVESICLPFVFVKQPTGESRTLDLRRCQIARLNKKYAKVAWKGYKSNKPSQVKI